MAARSFLLPLIMAAALACGAAAARESDALLAQARAAVGKGDIQSALRFAQAALVKEPARTDSYVLLGDLYARQSESDYARFYYEQALTIDPENGAAQAGLGKLESNPKPSADAALDKQ